ncbi:MAG: hypothetical protein ACOY4L_08035 [Pseudomonadota bacterium]
MAKRLVRIERCVCKNQPFTRLKVLAAELDNDVELLVLATGASTDCGRCRPWVERMLATGQTCFLEELEDDARGRDLAAHFGEEKE